MPYRGIVDVLRMSLEYEEPAGLRAGIEQLTAKASTVPHGAPRGWQRRPPGLAMIILLRVSSTFPSWWIGIRLFLSSRYSVVSVENLCFLPVLA